VDKQFLKKLQHFLAITSVGPSTARGMGPRKTISQARECLSQLDLKTFRPSSRVVFERRLNLETEKLKSGLPPGGQHWGSARKFLNIFLRGVVYNRFLCEEFCLYRLEPWLEVPLDSHVAKKLRTESGGAQLQPWKTVIGLEQDVSREYQKFAEKVAKRKQICRVHLDLFFWRAN